MAGSTWRLWGRVLELGACLEAIRPGAAPTGLVVVGEAGIGKSRLLDEALSQAGPGRDVERVGGTPGAAGIPFGCFVGLVDRVGSGAVPADLIDTLRVLRRELAVRASSVGGLVLAVDDAHLLDHASASLLAQVAGLPGVHLLVALRADAPTPAEVTSLWKDGCCTRLDLGPLTVEAVAGFASEVVGGPLETGSVEALHRTSGGNPLFVRELLEDAHAAGRLSLQRGLWRWQGTAGGARLRNLVAAHLGRLGPEALDLLDALALGGPIPVSALDELGPPEAAIALEAAGVIGVEDRSGTSRVVVLQPLFVEVQRASMGALRARAVAGRLAEVLAPLATAGSEDQLRAVALAREAGRPVGATALLEACRTARRGGDVGLAQALAIDAVDAGAGPVAELELAELLELGGQPDQAWDALRDLDARLSEPALQARARTGAVRVLAHGRHDPDAAAALVASWAPLADPAWSAVVDAQWLTTAAMLGRIDSVREPVRLLDEGADPVVRLRALTAANLVDVADGRLEAALERARSMVPVALSVTADVPSGVSWVTSALLLDLLLAGRLSETEALLDLVAADTASTLPSYRAFLLSARARCHLQRGRAALARDAARESAALWTDGSDDQGFLPSVLAVLSAACAVLGDGPGALAVAGEAEELMAASEPRVLHLDVERLTAWAPLGSGDARAALSGLVAAADRARGEGQRTFELSALHDAVRLGAPRSTIARLEALSATVEGPYAAAAGLHAGALLRADAPGLERAAGAFGELGADLVAAEVCAAAARRFAQQGLRSSAQRTALASARLARRLDGVSTPGLVPPSDSPPLSARELQVATAAARGATSRRIGAELDISARTVDNLLARAYVKLGISGRRDLAGVLGLDGDHGLEGDDEGGAVASRSSRNG